MDEFEADLLLGSEGVRSSPKSRAAIEISAAAAAAATAAEIGVEDGVASKREGLPVAEELASGVQPGDAMIRL